MKSHLPALKRANAVLVPGQGPQKRPATNEARRTATDNF